MVLEKHTKVLATLVCIYDIYTGLNTCNIYTLRSVLPGLSVKFVEKKAKGGKNKMF